MLVGLEMEGDEAVGHGDCVHIGRAQIGVVTSATRSPILKKTIALARLDVTHAELGTEVEVGKLDGHQKRLPARIVRFPHYDPEKTRVRCVIGMIRAVLLDLAGVVYQGEQPLPGAVDAVACLRQAGLRLRFLTNTTRMPRRALLSRLADMGIGSPTRSCSRRLRPQSRGFRRRRLSPHLLIHPALQEDFANLPASGTEAVVIGDAADGFTYAALNAAFRKLLAGAEFLALARNRSFKDEDGELSLDTGAFVAALEYAAQREAVVLGKPAPDFFKAALASTEIDGKEAVMVGDDAEADVAGALCGRHRQRPSRPHRKYRPGDETRVEPRPSETVADLAAAARWIMERSA